MIPTRDDQLGIIAIGDCLAAQVSPSISCFKVDHISGGSGTLRWSDPRDYDDRAAFSGSDSGGFTGSCTTYTISWSSLIYY